MTGAELAARKTAARAALGDFRHQVNMYVEAGAPPPPWQEWAFRFSSELAALLAELDATPGESQG